MADTSAGKPQKAIQRGKGKALNALAAASGRDPALIAKEVAKAAALKEEEERLKRQAEEKRSRVQATPAGVYNSLSPEEQYRFECFRRCNFPSRPIEQFVARAMVEEANKRCLVRKSVMVGLGVPSQESIDNLQSTDIENPSIAVDGNDTSSAGEKSNQKKRRRKRTKKSLLIEESKRRRDAMDRALPYASESASTTTGVPSLESLVVPDSASEIVAVVSTLAKCYAQRLVAAARRVADAEEAVLFHNPDEEEKPSDENEEAADSSEAKFIKPLQPHHYMEAHRHRVKAGIDPGFWMVDMIQKGRNSSVASKCAGVGEAAAVGRKGWNSAHLAALAAQDEYDEMVKEDEDQADQMVKEDENQTDQDAELKMDEAEKAG
ncbi:hypothetical protein ACHAWO_010299 [Cyclotella atomus]|jgi:hypothetical protein|uniref:Ribosome biogenesis protein NOP53 n=1 Tax=Cyclotella atomus TaxID=382360 RepID=A0ABD3Q8C3_9STRA